MSLTQINKAGLDEIALDHVFTIGASGNSAYTFQGEGLNGTVNNPTLYLTRGKTYRFENGTGGHPIRIQSTSGASGTAYNTGVTNNAQAGTVIVEVQHDAPDVLYYQCTSHAAMNGILYITGALADGGVTTAKIADDAVNNDKLANSVVASIAANTAKTSNATHTGDVTGSTSLTIANDAVTGSKILNGAVTLGKLASGSVPTSAIIDTAVTLAKLEHGTSSNDGKFLRANNGADPTFETIPPAAITAVSSTGANRVITDDGDGTATAESSLIFDGTKLAVTGSTVGNGVSLEISSAASNSDSRHIDLVRGGNHGYVGMAGSQPNDPLFLSRSGGRDVIVSSAGKVGIGMSSGSSPDDTLDVNGTMQATGNAYFSSTIYALGNDVRIGGTGTGNSLSDYEYGSWTPAYAPSGGNYGSITYHTQTGQYVKIGRFVMVQFYINYTIGSTSGNFRMSGLPFAASSYGAGSGMWQYHGMNNNRFYVLHTSNDSYIYAYGSESGANWESMSNDNQAAIIGTISYYTTA